MKKVVACLLCVILLFQMTSCYRFLLYDYTYESTEQTETTYLAETKNSLHYGEPLDSYVVYRGITDALPASGSYRPSYRRGICRNFSGTPVVVLLFMDDDESFWTEDEVHTFTNESVMPALDFLKREAAFWNVELDFVLESYSTPTTGYTIDFFGVMPTTSKEAVKEDAFEQAAGDLGFASDWIFYSYLQSQYPTQDIVFLTIFNKDGRSFTVQHKTGYHRGGEHCVIYSGYASYSAPMVAHEILHLFGAEDLYAENASVEIEEITKKEFPNDIMWTYLDDWGNQVEAYTAYAVGWTSEIPEVCYLEEWKFD